MKQLKTSQPVTVFADSRPGGRRENQDSCAWGDTQAGFLVTVCDGMGGGPSGKEASVLAAQSLLQYIQKHGEEEADRCLLMRKAIESANLSILDAVKADPEKKGMGTTLTALLINEYSAVVAHVGDSRVYQFRHGRKHFRTFDHSLVFAKLLEHEIRSEEEARVHPDSNVILRALGISETVKPDIVELAYEKGDRFMLCTDGIWGAFPEKTIISIAAKTPSLSGAVESMVVRVDEEGFAMGGGHDNLTLALLETKTTSKMHETMSTRQKTFFMILAAVALVSILLNVFLIIKNKPAGKSADGAGFSKIDSLVYVVNGLNEELKDAQARLKKAEENHAQFVKEVDGVGGNQVKVAERVKKEQDSINKQREKRDSLREELKDIINRTEELKTMSAKQGEDATNKENIVKAVRTDFEAFAQKAKKADTQDAKNVMQWLKEDIAKQDDVNYRHKGKSSTEGQYNAILSAMNRILNSI